MPAEMWASLDDFNERLDDTVIAGYLERAETYSVDAVVAQLVPRAIQLARQAIQLLTPAAQRGLESLSRLLGRQSIRSGNLTLEGLAHILQRHGPDSAATNAGRFAAGTSAQDLTTMINAALRNGTFRPNTLARPGHIFEFDLGRMIGTNSAGGATSLIRVVRDPSGNIRTAFPY